MSLVAMQLRLKDATDKHIDPFEELMETSETNMSGAYSYSFMTLPDTCKEDLTKFFLKEKLPQTSMAHIVLSAPLPWQRNGRMTIRRISLKEGRIKTSPSLCRDRNRLTRATDRRSSAT